MYSAARTTPLSGLKIGGSGVFPQDSWGRFLKYMYCLSYVGKVLNSRFPARLKLYSPRHLDQPGFIPGTVSIITVASLLVNL